MQCDIDATSGGGSWCCAEDSKNCCSNTDLKIGKFVIGNVTVANVGLARSSTKPSSDAVTATITGAGVPGTTTKFKNINMVDSSNSSMATAKTIGLAVGIPLGLLFLGAMALIGFLLHKRKTDVRTCEPRECRPPKPPKAKKEKYVKMEDEPELDGTKVVEVPAVELPQELSPGLRPKQLYCAC